MSIKKFKRIKLLLYIGIAFMAAAMIVLWCGIIFNISNRSLIIAELVAAIILAFAGCTLMITYNVKVRAYSAWLDKEVFKNVVKYDPLPCCEIDDYAKELEVVRRNYIADSDENKNQLTAKTIKEVKKQMDGTSEDNSFTDLDVLKTGKICYGYIVNKYLNIDVMNNVPYKYGIIKVLYSPDKYFEANPQKLDEILNDFVRFGGNTPDGNSMGNFQQVYLPFVFNYKIPTEVTDGRDVYITSIIVERRQLPLGFVTEDYLPIIVSQDNASSAFVVDCKYWGDDFVAYYAYRGDSYKYAQFNRKRISEFTEHTCGDYAEELKNIRKKYIADKSNEPLDLKGENPFPILNFSDLEFYYALPVYSYKKSCDFPLTCLYSEDDYYTKNPKELVAIADRVFADKKEWAKVKKVVNIKGRTIGTYQLPDEFTNGGKVMVTALFADIFQLPLCGFRPFPVPVFRSRENSLGDDFFHLLDCTYWSNGFTYEYANAKK